MHLATIRKKLDALDVRLVALVAKRQSYMKEVARYKKEQGLPVHQSARERQILAAKKKQGKVAGLDPKLVEALFRALFKNARDIQRREIRRAK